MNTMTFLARFGGHGALGFPVFLLMLTLAAVVVLAVVESKEDRAKK